MKRQFAKIADFEDCGAGEMSIPQSWVDYWLARERERENDDWARHCATDDEPKCGLSLADFPIVDD